MNTFFFASCIMFFVLKIFFFALRTFYHQYTYVTLEHKTSHNGQFSKIEINASSESWINNLSIDVWFVMIGQYLIIRNLRVQKNLNIEKIIFKVVQMKLLAMHITI